MILIPLEHLHTSRDSIRKAREAFLIHRGKTLESWACDFDRLINFKEDTSRCLIFSKRERRSERAISKAEFTLSDH